MLKRVQAHKSIMERQQVSTNWNFTLDHALPVNTGDQYIEAMSKVCDGLRGDAFVAAQEVGVENLCEIFNGKPSGSDTLIQPHARNVPLPRQNTNPKNYSAKNAVLEDLCPDKTEKV